jgi:hypothetical protein
VADYGISTDRYRTVTQGRYTQYVASEPEAKSTPASEEPQDDPTTMGEALAWISPAAALYQMIANSVEKGIPKATIMMILVAIGCGLIYFGGYRLIKGD